MEVLLSESNQNMLRHSKYKNAVSLPGKRFLKYFFKIDGPMNTIKFLYFDLYSKYKKRSLHLDPNGNHLVKVNDYQIMIIPTDLGISAELAIFKIHEPVTSKIVCTYVKNGMSCLDIGSNIGYYAILESRLAGPKGNVVCVEPSPLNYRYLKSNLEREAKGRTKIYNVAVGDTDGEINFLVGAQSNLCKVIQENEMIESSESNSILKVPVKKVDSLVEEIELDKIDFIRMDPEGYEESIYRGMRKTIDRFKPMLLIEFHSNILGTQRTRKLLENMKRDGYEIIYFIPRRLDNPIIGKMKYAQSVNFDWLFEKLENDTVPAGFNLLVNDAASLDKLDI